MSRIDEASARLLREKEEGAEFPAASDTRRIKKFERPGGAQQGETATRCGDAANPAADGGTSPRRPPRSSVGVLAF